MNEKMKIKEAFDKIHAEEELKEKTKEFVLSKINDSKNQAKTYSFPRKIMQAAAVFVVFLSFAGGALCFVPTVEISIDINPSIELGVNTFGRIVSVEGQNSDGKALADSLDIRFLNYSDAVNKIVESEKISSLLSKDEILTISVIGNGRMQSKQSKKILTNMRSFAKNRQNTYCYYAPKEEVKNAHKAGFSYGKYRAFLKLKSLDSTVTEEKIRRMTMREIHSCIESHIHDELETKMEAEPWENSMTEQKSTRRMKNSAHFHKKHHGHEN